jgi:hypothetical protein
MNWMALAGRPFQAESVASLETMQDFEGENPTTRYQ